VIGLVSNDKVRGLGIGKKPRKHDSI
jgi:hypothetical protein